MALGKKVIESLVKQHGKLIEKAAKLKAEMDQKTQALRFEIEGVEKEIERLAEFIAENQPQQKPATQEPGEPLRAQDAG